MKTIFIRVSFQVQVPDETDIDSLYLDVDPYSVSISQIATGEDDSKDKPVAFTDLSWETTSTVEKQD